MKVSKKNTDLKEIKVLVGLDVDEYNDLLIEFGKDYKNNEYKENKKVTVKLTKR